MQRHLALDTDVILAIRRLEGNVLGEIGTGPPFVNPNSFLLKGGMRPGLTGEG
jgi:hypothetical protein